MNELLLNTLESLNIPIYYIHKFDDIEHNQYIVFTTTQEELIAPCDGEYEFRDYRINIRIYSKTDYTELVKSVEKLLKQAGFRRKNSAEFFEKEIEYYLKSMFYEISLKEELEEI